ncbi:hypothetical protein [Marivita sp. GX14005]|uniref:hypothetical protein n=1 Tax=Marivita sp. GX14005 TaxID=2942276 RepID=UPI0020190EA3|nr:hypothetical protein [Marivita sp. GX14005]MCL3880763.1 hypothetical protein [Marivita sp. GX14005]
MQIALHTGLHETGADRLLRTLLRNRDGVRPMGVAVPGPGKYRRLISEWLNALGAEIPAPGTREVLLDAMLDEDGGHVDRLILSHENLFSVPKIAFQGGVAYRRAPRRLRALADVFAPDEIEIFIALRSPVTLLPALLATTPHQTLETLLGGLDPAELRWSELMARITQAVPGVPITVWCDEDSPLIWGQVVREMLGVEPSYPLIGAYSRLADIMTQDGMSRFRAYLGERPGIPEIQLRRIMEAFLDKYADETKIEDELDLPGWDAAFVQEMSDRYEEDMFDLSRLPGVTLITP